ncbi:MAG: hypothetical protein C4582_06950 [Desulfobacteraceae bacterium]|jgi:hypothetical protein|nr:MAG: hypothetical protein C4582_06950 [Desulfobacteraceae bacterium]
MTFKKILFLAVAAACIYGLLFYHVIFVGNTISFLAKSSPSLNYTFFSTHGKSARTIVSIKELRQAGIADLLVQLGKMTEDEKEILLDEFSGVSSR